MSAMGQTHRFDPLPATSGLPRSTDINRPAQLVRLVPIPDSCAAAIPRLPSPEAGRHQKSVAGEAG